MEVVNLTKKDFEKKVAQVISKEFNGEDLTSPIKGDMIASLCLFSDLIANEIFGGD